jgi:hypothetical protein
MRFPRRVILHIVPPVAVADRPPRPPYAARRLKSVEGETSVSPHLPGVSVADGDKRWRRARPVQRGGVGASRAGSRRRHARGAKQEGHPLQPGRECWGGFPARCHRFRGPGSDTLLRKYCTYRREARKNPCRQGRSIAPWPERLGDSCVVSETENGPARPIQMAVPRGTGKSLCLTEATIVLIMARTGRYAARQRVEVADDG